MGGLSLWHILLLGIILLVLFGPNRLPALGKSLGEAIRGFKKGLDGSEIDVTNTARKEQIRDGDTAAPSGASSARTERETQKDKV